jgi:uncharacterized protein
MGVIFNGLAAIFDDVVALFLGWTLYLLIWCLLFPLWAVGKHALLAAFHRTTPRVGEPAWVSWLLLAIPVLVGFLLWIPGLWTETPFLSSPATRGLLLLAIPVALVNGTWEEVLWRGAYIRAFPGRIGAGFLYPSMGFGLWHLAPLSIHLDQYGPVEVAVILVGGIIFGLCWGWVAWRSGSIRWPVLSHICSNLVLMAAIVWG